MAMGVPRNNKNAKNAKNQPKSSQNTFFTQK